MTQTLKPPPSHRATVASAVRAEPANPLVDRAVPGLADEFTAWLITSLSVRLSRGASSYYTRHWRIGTTEYRLLLAPGREGPCTAPAHQKAAPM